MAKSGFPGFLITSVVVCLAAAGGGWYWWKGHQAAPIRYITTAVAEGTVTQAVTATGDLQPVTSVDVSSQISGLVLELLVDFNTPVKAGQVLARIDPATYESRLRQAKAELANTQASYDLVALNTKRSRELFDRNLVSQQELDQANALLAQAAAQLDIRQAAVENVQVDLARCEIVAPIDGVVISRETEVGKTVAASLNAPTLFTIANDLAKMQINAAVAEADIGQITEGQPVKFTVDAYPNRTFTGTVSQIRSSPTVSSNVVVYPVIIDVENRGNRLKPGMTASVAIVIAERANTVVLPNAALRIRVPEGVTVEAPAGSAPATAGAAATVPASREQMRELMTEAGFSPGAGGFSPELMAKVRELAAARGLSLPERFGNGGGGRGPGGGEGGGSPNQVTTRTVYTLRGEGPLATLQAVSVQCGITDGSKTEIVSGLNAGDTVVTTIIAPTSAASATNNPFGGGGRRF